MKGKNMRLYKRIASIALVLFMVIGLVPMMPAEVKAAEREIPAGYTAINIEEQNVVFDGSVIITESGKYYIYGTNTEVAGRIWVKGDIDVELVLDSVTISIAKSRPQAALTLEDGADVTLKLVGENNLSSGLLSPGVLVDAGNTITITSYEGDNKTSGVLNATGYWAAQAGSGGAGIGAASRANVSMPIETVGTIVIKGGTINATGTGGCAGIGGSVQGMTGTIRIEGGIVNAKTTSIDSSGAAAIGGGLAGCVESIEITGGEVYATSYKGSKAAAIGSGYCEGDGDAIGYGDIRITGGFVSANGADGVDDIGRGGGNLNTGSGSVYIKGASVKAESITNPTNGEYAVSLYEVEVAGLTEGTPVTYTEYYSFDGQTSTSHSLNNVVTKDTNKVYLWLEESTQHGVYANEKWYVRPFGSDTSVLCSHEDNAALWQEANCLAPETCSACGATKALGQKNPENHVSDDYIYEVNATDKTKHDKKHACCKEIVETTQHDYSSVGICTICEYRCKHINVVDNICQECGITGKSYIRREWDEEQKKVVENYAVTDGTITIVGPNTTTWTGGTGGAANWYVVEGDVSITERITVTGTVNLLLCDGAHLNATLGITVNVGNSLNIYVQSSDNDTMGKLTATVPDIEGISGGEIENKAAIGSDNSGIQACGTITINGGIIEANACRGAAIGGGWNQAGGTIIINAGFVTATNTSGGAAIGSGENSNGKAVGTVMINGGTVIANNTDDSVDSCGAGIGGGYKGSGYDVIINGGNVQASSVGNAIGAGAAAGSAEGVNGSLKNSAGNTLVLKEISFDGMTSESAITALTGVGAYGLIDAWTLDTDKLYLYLPESSVPSTITAGDAEYICNENLIYYASHNLGNASCDTAQTCSRCGAVYGEALGHSWIYKVENNAIIEACQSCSTAGGSLTINVPEENNRVYDGTIKLDQYITSTLVDTENLQVEVRRNGMLLTDDVEIISAGEYFIEVSIGDALLTESFEIAKAVPEIGTVVANPATLENTLDISQIRLSCDNAQGKLTVDKDQTLQLGANNIAYTFTPNDTVNYATVQGTVAVTVADTLAPTLKYQVGTNGWKEFINTITWGTFAKDYVEVTIQATDNIAGVNTLKYYVSDVALDAVALGNVEWQSYEEKIALNAGSKNYVYVIATDRANNTSILGLVTEGIVVYKDSVVEDVASREYKAGTDLHVAYTANGNTLVEVRYNGQPLNMGLEADYAVAANAEVVTFTSAWLDTLEARAHEITFVFHPQGVETTEVSLTETLTLTITPASLTVVGATATDRDYDGTKNVAITELTFSGVKDGDRVGLSFENVAGTLSSANAGTYTSVTLGDLSSLVTLTGADKDNYKIVFTGGNVTTNVTIDKVVAAVGTAPVANSLVFNDVAQALVTAGATNDGTFMYSLSEDGEYTASIPTATEIGEYTIWYYVAGDANHTDSAKASVQVAIKEGPHIENEEGKMGWDAILDEVEDVLASEEEHTVTVDMNGQTVVPADVLEEIKGKDVEVKFDLGDGIVWTVNGADITGATLEDIDFAVTISTEEHPINRIPVEVINKVTGEKSHTEISLAHDGEFGFAAVLTLNLKAENVGLFANLYYYNVTKNALEFICADVIAADGSVDLTFTHASDYTIVIDEKAADDVENEGPKTGDDSNVLLWTMLLMTGFAMIAFGYKRRVR